MLSARNIYDQKIVFDDFRLINEKHFAEEHRRTQINPGDVLLTIVGAIGRSACVDADVPPFTLQRSVAVIGNFVAVDGPYLNKVFQSPPFQAWMNENAKGTAQKGIYLKTLAPSRIPVPPAAEQRRIVAKIERLTARSERARSDLNAVRRLVAAFKIAVMEAGFNGLLTASWRKTDRCDAEVESWPLEMETSRKKKWMKEEIRKIVLKRKKNCEEKLLSAYEPAQCIAPASRIGWYETTVQQLGFVRGGKRLPAGIAYSDTLTPYRYLRVTDFSERSPDFNDLKCLSEEAHLSIDQYCIETDDVFISIAGTIGASGVANKALNGCHLTENAARIILSDRVCPSYLDLFFKSKQGQEKIRNVIVATGQPKLALFRLEKVLLPIPCYSEQVEIVRRIEHAFAAIDRLAAEAQAAGALLDRLDQAILAKAFRGELVPQDPNDEPASVLLERIRAERAAAPAKARGRKKAS